MNHFGLFEGIGAPSLAAKWVGWITKAWCEIDPFCQKVLRKNFQNAHGFGDIKKLTYATYKSVLRNRGDRDRRINIITGGFPCQPYSTAGKRTGNDDDRALWPEMLRTIREFKPRWVVGENVAGIISMDGGNIFAGIVTDLEDAGYSVETYLIPACGVGAPHKRDRVWIVAHSNGCADRAFRDKGRNKNGVPKKHREKICTGQPFGAIRGVASNAKGKRCRKTGKYSERSSEWPSCENSAPITLATGGRRYRRADIKGKGQAERRRIERDHQRANANTNGAGLQELNAPAQPGWAGFGSGEDVAKWDEHWLQVATRVCRVDDGVSRGMDSVEGLQPEPAKKSKAAGRGHRLKALGNSMVPQVVYQIFKAISEYEKQKK